MPSEMKFVKYVVMYFMNGCSFTIDHTVDILTCKPGTTLYQLVFQAEMMNWFSNLVILYNQTPGLLQSTRLPMGMA